MLALGVRLLVSILRTISMFHRMQTKTQTWKMASTTINCQLSKPSWLRKDLSWLDWTKLPQHNGEWFGTAPLFYHPETLEVTWMMMNHTVFGEQAKTSGTKQTTDLEWCSVFSSSIFRGQLNFELQLVNSKKTRGLICLTKEMPCQNSHRKPPRFPFGPRSICCRFCWNDKRRVSLWVMQMVTLHYIM